MILVGLILLIIGIIAAIPLLFWAGVILLLIGAVFWVAGGFGRPRYW